MFHQLIHINYATLLIIVFMITFLLSNTIFSKRITRLFFISILCVLFLVIADSIETWTESLPEPTTLRILVSAIGYTLRPLGILFILLIIIRGKEFKHSLLYIPAILNAIISFSALFTDIAFSYTPDNQFKRGPLGISAYVACAIYLLILFCITIYYVKERHIYESMIIFFMLLVTVISLILEVSLSFDGFINATFAVSITFYYLFFHAQTSKRDVLTHAFNRRCFYDDASRNFSQLKGVISIDLNDLKILNDTNGHACGDTALCTIVSVLKKTLPAGCTLYRTGGDEFMILCFKQEQESLEKLVQTMRDEIKKTPYTCAFGLATFLGNETFDQICARADAIMYRDKARLKGAK